ncbi:hypothetical protein SAMN04488009_1121 [Maribacter sedimenticola]|uniref:Bacteriorhodopsin-like protein n=2 Tax=Maribacter sedimenticola TaxID=228956 RepID=A0ABY1SE95_9FLAO|nr:hypothetical protein SAMN04488009_1121 [Maribacter sedimenticola]
MEYLINNYFILFYALALVLSIGTYKHYYNSILKYLPILFTYTMLTELFGMIIRDIDDIQIIYKEEYYNYNTPIFNIFDIIFYLYFLYIYYKLSTNTLHKEIIKYGGMAFLLTCIINLWIQDFYTEPQVLAIIIGSLLLIFGALTYLRELNSKIPRTQRYTTLLFWVSTGLLIFYSCYPITMYLLSFKYDIYIQLGLTNLHYASIAAMYTCFIIGFISMKRVTPRYGW